MPPFAPIAVLLASAAHATCNLFAKRAAGYSLALQAGYRASDLSRVYPGAGLRPP